VHRIEMSLLQRRRCRVAARLCNAEP
jgi:hypothetical protein